MPAALLLGWRHGDRLKRALHRSRTALHAAREQLDTILDRAPVGIVQTDLDGRILMVNGSYCGLVGHEAQHLCTLKLHDLTHPEDRPQHLEQHAKMLATGQPFHIEKRLVRADASNVWVISHLAITHDADGRPMHVIAAVQDISHRRAAAEALQTVNATLEQRVAQTVAERVATQENLWRGQRMEALGQLAGGVAHDFNNVLQAIAGGARLIQRRPDNAAAVERLAGLIVDAAERGTTVTQRLLSFARRGPLQPGPVDTAGLLIELRDILAGTLGSGILVQVAVPDTLPHLLADKAQLETVLVSLATNARDAMLGDGPADEVRSADHTLRLSAMVVDGATVGLPAKQFVQIDVADTGPGMDADVLERATEPFFTTKPRGRSTGLSLAMARGFAEQSGGKLLLRSQAGQGTTASLLLPRLDTPAGKPADATLAPAASGKPRIVLVDDDAEVLEALSEVLTSCDYTVSTFANAVVARSYLHNGELADLLITDLSMPDIDGLTLIREARRRLPGLPALLLTGYSETEVAPAAKSLPNGRLMLLQKPIRAAELTMQVAALLSDATPSPV